MSCKPGYASGCFCIGIREIVIIIGDYSLGGGVYRFCCRSSQRLKSTKPRSSLSYFATRATRETERGGGRRRTYANESGGGGGEVPRDTLLCMRIVHTVCDTRYSYWDVVVFVATFSDPFLKRHRRRRLCSFSCCDMYVISYNRSCFLFFLWDGRRW